MGDFSKKDLWMLFEISSNARSPLNKIAKKLKMSQQGVAYKLQKFKESGLLEGYSTVFDYASVGYQGYKVLIHLNKAKAEQGEQLLKQLIAHSSVLSITELAGHWDYLVLFATKNASRCNKELHTLLAQFPKVLKNYYVLTNTVTYDLKRRYLTEHATHTGTMVLGGDRESIKLEQMDQKILKELYENPRISYVTLSSKYKATPKTMLARVRALETKGIIKSYTAHLNVTHCGYHPQKMFLKFSNLTLEREEELIRFLRRKENVISMSKVFGIWDFEVDTEFSNMLEQHTFVKELRVQLGDIIREMELCPVLKIHKQTTLPESFFSNST